MPSIIFEKARKSLRRYASDSQIMAGQRRATRILFLAPQEGRKLEDAPKPALAGVEHDLF